MSRIIIPFVISFIAGISTVLGSFFIMIKPHKVENFIGTSLAFSATIMILISLFELIPNGFYYLNYKYNYIYAIIILIIMIIIGLLINITINKMIKNKVGKGSSLYRIGILSMLALMIHNLPEGILTFLSSSVDINLGLKLGLAIMLHNIPEGIAIAVPLYYSTYSKSSVVKGTMLSGLSEPLGALLAYLFLYKYLNNTLISYILLFVAGIMISISINDIFEEAFKHSKKSIVVGVVLGIIVFIITEVVL